MQTSRCSSETGCHNAGRGFESEYDESVDSKLVFYTKNGIGVCNELHEDLVPVERYSGDSPDTPVILTTKSKHGMHLHIRRVPDKVCS